MIYYIIILFFILIIFIFQGTILDRIDYNIEHASVQVEKGLQQLQKAEKYQKKNRKMHIILVLAVIIIVLIFILIGVKSWYFTRICNCDNIILGFTNCIYLSVFGYCKLNMVDVYMCSAYTQTEIPRLVVAYMIF